MSVPVQGNPIAGRFFDFATKSVILRLQEISIVPVQCGRRSIVGKHSPTAVQRLRVRRQFATIIQQSFMDGSERRGGKRRIGFIGRPLVLHVRP